MNNKLTPEEVKAIQNDPDNVTPIVDLQQESYNWPQESYDWPFDAPIDDFKKYIYESEVGVSRKKCLYLLERCKQAEKELKLMHALDDMQRKREREEANDPNAPMRRS